jgi:hypothetical protein
VEQVKVLIELGVDLGFEAEIDFVICLTFFEHLEQ